MFKALLAAWVAMLACCAAAAFAGVVDPVSELDVGSAPDARAGQTSPLRLIANPHENVPPPPMERFVAAEGFVPTVSLGGAYGSTVAAAPESADPLQPVAPPAVIPLPAPLYAGAALLALTLLARRAILRAC